MADVVRVNTRISRKLNEWLNRRSHDTGLSKCADNVSTGKLLPANRSSRTDGEWEAIYREVGDLKTDGK